MSKSIRIAFYGREEYVHLPAEPAEFQHLLAAAKQLALRRRDVASHYRLDLSADIAAVIAIAEIQAIVFIENAVDAPGVAEIVNGTRLLADPGAALFLKGRQHPVVLRNTRNGPLGDMVVELTSSRYGEHDLGCVMLADEKDNPVFLVLDELQYMLVSRELLQP